MKKTIKLMTLFLFAATLTTAISCSKSNENLIVGKWKLTQVSRDGVNWSEPFIAWVYEYKSDGTVIAAGMALSYTLDGNMITIYDSGETETAEIVTLTNSELVLKEVNSTGEEYMKYVRIE